MLRLTQPQESLWDQLLPPHARILSDELARVDAFLADERLFEPYRQRFHTRVGRPTVPVDTYLRLMYLKHRYKLGYEMLVGEVADSLHWRRFCRIPLDEDVPHSTTLSKLTRKYGPEVLHELNRVLMGKARERKVLRGRKLRMDTTVIEAPIEHPTDIGLLADGARVITRLVKRLHAAGAAVRTTFRSRSRTIKQALRRVGQALRTRTGEAQAAVERQTAQVFRATRHVVRQAKRVLTNSRRVTRQVERTVAMSLKRTRARLHDMLSLSERLIGQTAERLRGNRSIPDRLVSLFDPEARPIRRGKLHAKTEFGYKALITETEERLIPHYEVHQGAVGDADLLASAFTQHVQIIGRMPRAVATDRGFGSKRNEGLLLVAGVKRISLPYTGRVGAERRQHEGQGWFRRLQRWRAGQEATISLGSRKYEWRQSRLRGKDGTDVGLGLGVLTANLQRLAILEKSAA